MICPNLHLLLFNIRIASIFFDHPSPTNVAFCLLPRSVQNTDRCLSGCLLTSPNHAAHDAFGLPCPVGLVCQVFKPAQRSPQYERHRLVYATFGSKMWHRSLEGWRKLCCKSILSSCEITILIVILGCRSGCWYVMDQDYEHPTVFHD